MNHYKHFSVVFKTTKLKQQAMLSQGELRDATVNFDTNQILQWYSAVSLPQHGFLVGL